MKVNSFKWLREMLAPVALTASCSAAALLGAAGQASASNICPPLGADTNCQTLITINANNSVSIGYNLNNGPYDGAEDTLVGVLNLSSTALSVLSLSGNYIFGFDGDGQASYSGTSYDSSGYAGPNNTFNIINSDTGDVLFTNPLAQNQSTWFTLEEDIQSVTVSGLNGGHTPPPVVGSVPLPATGILLLSAFFGLGGARRRYKQRSA